MAVGGEEVVAGSEVDGRKWGLEALPAADKTCAEKEERKLHSSGGRRQQAANWLSKAARGK